MLVNAFYLREAKSEGSVGVIRVVMCVHAYVRSIYLRAVGIFAREGH